MTVLRFEGSFYDSPFKGGQGDVITEVVPDSRFKVLTVKKYHVFRIDQLFLI